MPALHLQMLISLKYTLLSCETIINITLSQVYKIERRITNRSSESKWAHPAPSLPCAFPHLPLLFASACSTPLTSNTNSDYYTYILMPAVYPELNYLGFHDLYCRTLTNFCEITECYILPQDLLYKGIYMGMLSCGLTHTSLRTQTSHNFHCVQVTDLHQLHHL